jgi:DNA-binding response OmpR family regulator
MSEDQSDSKILVVDDDKHIITLLKETLEQEKWQVFAAMDGAEAIHIFNKVAPDMVVLDLMLPDISGEDVCRYIRGKSSVPVLVLSARTNSEAKIECLDIGADDYVTKPFVSRELTARVRALLRRARVTIRETAQPIFTCGDLEINFNARRVTVSDKEVLLTPKEYELLKTLATHHGNAITYDELLSSVWGEKYRGEKGYIHNFISHLRVKIEPDPDNPQYIISSPRFGYYFKKA